MDESSDCAPALTTGRLELVEAPCSPGGSGGVGVGGDGGGGGATHYKLKKEQEVINYSRVLGTRTENREYGARRPYNLHYSHSTETTV